MNKENKFSDIYMRAEEGEFDRAYWDMNKGDQVGLDVKKVKTACCNHEIDFDEFLDYAQKRKKGETE